MLLPLRLLVITEVTLESLLAPGAVDRVGNRSECRNGLILARVAEELRRLTNGQTREEKVRDIPK